MDVYATFLETIRRHRLLKAGDRVLVAVSGGSDSTALLHLFLSLRRSRLAIDLAIAHVDHGTRGPEAREDAAFVDSMARREGLQISLHRLPPSPGNGASEDHLRAGRLSCLWQAAQRWPATHLALGHTRDDQTETVLLNLMRGAGRRGLGGMPIIRAAGPSGAPAGPAGPALIRPLLRLPRASLREWLAQKGIPWRVDSSNREPRYLRNRLRHELLPLLEELRPGSGAAIARAAHLLQEDEVFLSDLARQAAGMMESGERARLSTSRLRRLAPPLARRVLRRAARGRGGGDAARGRVAWVPGAVQVDSVLRLVRSRRTGHVDLGQGVVARVGRSAVTFAGTNRRGGGSRRGNEPGATSR
ncbi:MAG: tRNA lysidine(34) synthetase TilS [Acidobacteriota bacterium]